MSVRSNLKPMRKKKVVRQFVAQAEAQAELERQRLEQQIEAELRRVVQAGTPEDDALAQAYSNLARPFARAALEPDEAIRQELAVFSQTPFEEFVITYLMVTDKGLIWSPYPKFETALRLFYADVVSVSGGSMEREDEADNAKGLTITYGPRDFPDELRRFNPTGELDATFVFLDSPDEEQARMSIMARMGYPGPRDDVENRLMLQRFRAASTDITTWTTCPYCCNDLDRPQPSIMRCRSGPNQLHMFSAPDTQPVIDESDGNFGAVIGEEPWMPILESELELVGLPLIWMAWRDRPFGPPMILDYETIRAVWGKG